MLLIHDQVDHYLTKHICGFFYLKNKERKKKKRTTTNTIIPKKPVFSLLVELFPPLVDWNDFFPLWLFYETLELGWKLHLWKKGTIVVFNLCYALESARKLCKKTCLGLSPRNSDLIGLGKAGASLWVTLICSQGWKPPSLQEKENCQ